MPNRLSPHELPWILWLLRVLSDNSEQKQNKTWIVRYLRALLGIKESDKELISSAQSYLSVDKTGQWIVDPEWVKAIPSQIIPKENLTTHTDCAMFIMAMGELFANCNGFPIEECRDLLCQSPCFKELNIVLKEMGKLASKYYPAPEANLDREQSAQFILTCNDTYESYSSIQYLIGHPPRLPIDNRWGLALGARIVAELNFKAFGDWLHSETDPTIICPSMYDFPTYAYFWDRDQIKSALSSTHPFLRWLAIASLHISRDDIAISGWKFSIEEVVAICDSANFNKYDTVWTTFKRIDDLHSGIVNSKHHLDHLCFNGADNEFIEKEKLRQQQLQILFEKSMEQIAATYPSEGLPDNKAELLIIAARGNLLLPLQLAQMLTTRAQNSLLKVITERFEEKASLSKEIDLSTIYQPPYDWQEDMPQAVKAFVGLYEAKDVGRQIGRRVQTFVKSLTPLSKQPYLFNRNFTLWTNVYGRLALTHLYALQIAIEAKEKSVSGHKFLLKKVTPQAVELLTNYCGEYFEALFLRLALICVEILDTHPTKDLTTAVHNLIKTPIGCSLVKLRFILSSLEMYKHHKEIALSLILVPRQLPIEEDDLTCCFGAYLDSIDKILTYSVQERDNAVTKKIINSWNDTLSKWQDDRLERWSDFPKKIVQALAGDPDSLAWLASTPEFQNSASRLYCEKQYDNWFKSHT